MSAGPGHRYVEFAVDDHAVLLEGVVGEEIELVRPLDGEAVKDVVTLTALIPLYGVDGDVVEYAHAPAVDGIADGGYLVAVWHDDADGLAGIKRHLIYIIYLIYGFCYLLSLDSVGLVRC